MLRDPVSDQKRPKREFVWRGLGLHLGTHKEPVLWLVADAIWPHLYRVVYPDGWTSSPANLTRAKDAAYGHARHLLVTLEPEDAVQTAEPDLVLTMPPEANEAA
jgi:hypothetical protein